MRRLILLGIALASAGAAQAADCTTTLNGVCQDIAGYVRPADVPSAGDQAPPATALDGAQGASMQYARADHTHAVRVQRVAMTTAADGTVTWTFARPIVVASGKVPPMSYMVEDTGSPVVVQVTGRTFTTSGGLDTHTAVTVRAQRSRALPATLVSVAALVGFDIFQVAANVRVNLWAADPTQ